MTLLLLLLPMMVFPRFWGAVGGPSGDALLKEDGEYVLLETGDFILLE